MNKLIQFFNIKNTLLKGERSSVVNNENSEIKQQIIFNFFSNATENPVTFKIKMFLYNLREKTVSPIIVIFNLIYMSLFMLSGYMMIIDYNFDIFFRLAKICFTLLMIFIGYFFINKFLYKEINSKKYALKDTFIIFFIMDISLFLTLFYFI